MQSASEFDGLDFKPFFDMVVGILFVLLILVAALLFFQQADQHVVEKVKQHAEWQKERADFLAALAEDLRKIGLEPQVDLPNASIVLPLTGLAGLRSDGLPAVLPEPLGGFGRVLEKDLACVTGRGSSRGCENRRLLRLDGLPIQLRVTAAAPAVLPQDRFSQLLAALMQGSLMTASPELLKMSSPSGEILMHIAGASGAGPAPVAPPTRGIAGEAVLAFDFAPP